MNDDAKIDGADMQTFVEVLLDLETDPILIAHADFDESGTVDWADVPPFVVTLLVGVPHGDVNRDDRVDGTDIQPFVHILLGEYDPEADLNADGVVDLADVPLFVDVLLFGPPSPSSAITLYAEGLAASSDLCDAPIDLLTDPEGDGTFALAGTEELTVVDVTFSPLSGGIGTPVTITLTPAVLPLAFNDGTTARWSGVFQPIVGSPTDNITINYSESQFRETLANQAILIVGDSSVSQTGDISRDSLAGAMVGQMTINFGIVEVSKPLQFVPTSGPVITQIGYDQDALPFVVDPSSATLEIVMTTNGNGADETLLAGQYFNHLVVALEVDRNLITEAEAPAAITVTLISRTHAGADLQTVPNLSLLRNDVASSPTAILYHSDFSVPIVLTDVLLDPNDYSLVIPVYAADQGEIAILPEGF
ncbi:MAG: hypothetical protein ABII12_04045 [Planctomycetota bacterium]